MFQKEDVKTFCFQTQLQNYNYDKVEIYYFIQIKEEVDSLQNFSELINKKYTQTLKKINFQRVNHALYTEYELIENTNHQLIKNRLFLIIPKGSIEQIQKQVSQQQLNSIQSKLQCLFVETAKFYNTIYEKLDQLALNAVPDFVFMIKAIIIQNNMTVISDLQILLLANSISEQITEAVQNSPKQVEVLLKRLLYDIVEKMDPSSKSQYNYDIKDQNQENTEVCTINITAPLTEAQKRNIYLYFKYIKENIIAKMTYYLNNPLYTQQLGKILFPLLINRHRYIQLNQFEYKLVFSSKQTLKHSIQKLYIAFDTLIQYLDFQLQNYDIKIQTTNNTHEITFQCNFAQNINHIHPMVMGPLTTASQTEQLDFKYVFGEAAHIRHFQTGQNKYCVDNRELTNIYEILQKYIFSLLKQFGLKDVQLTFQSDNIKQINKVLPRLQHIKTLYECANKHINQTMDSIQSSIQSNRKLPFIMRDYKIFNFNVAMLELPIRKKTSTKRTNSIKVLSTLDFQVSKDFSLQTYQAILTFKQLFIEQIMKFMNLNVNEKLLYIGASGFNIQIQFVCNNTEYEMVLEIHFVLNKELDFLGLINFEKESLIRLMNIKAFHNSFLKNLSDSELVVIKLVKRFIAAHLVPLFTIDIDFNQEFHWNLFNSPAYKHFEEKFKDVELSFFKDSELKQLFDQCNEFLNKQLAVPPTAIYAGKMINEELIEQLCAFYIQNRSFYDKDNIIKNFQGCILFLASITEYQDNGVVFSTLKAEDLYLNQDIAKNKVKVFLQYDPDAAMSLDIPVNAFSYNNFNRIVTIAVQQQFSAGIFKPSVSHVTHVLVLHDEVRFSQFNQNYQISVASRTVKPMKQVADFNNIIINIHNINQQQQNNSQFQHIDPIKYVVSIINQFTEFQVFYDYYGGTNIYLQFKEQKSKELDLTQMHNQLVLPDNTIVTNEKYIISQILLKTGIFSAVVVENGRKQWEQSEQFIPGQDERYQGVQNNDEQSDVSLSDGDDMNGSINMAENSEEYEDFEEYEEAEE